MALMIALADGNHACKLQRKPVKISSTRISVKTGLTDYF